MNGASSGRFPSGDLIRTGGMIDSPTGASPSCRRRPASTNFPGSNNANRGWRPCGRHDGIAAPVGHCFRRLVLVCHRPSADPPYMKIIPHTALSLALCNTFFLVPAHVGVRCNRKPKSLDVVEVRDCCPLDSTGGGSRRRVARNRRGDSVRGAEPGVAAGLGVRGDHRGGADPVPSPGVMAPGPIIADQAAFRGVRRCRNDRSCASATSSARNAIRNSFIAA